jgi:hypothetical protein
MTSRKILCALVLVVFTAGWSFAQTGEPAPAEDVEPAPQTETETPQKEAEPAPKKKLSNANTITVDFGPTIIGAVYGGVGNLVGGETGLSSSGFGIAAQYERQLRENLTVAGRFAYLGFGFGTKMSEEGLSAQLRMDISSFSIEGHLRFYPSADTFFLDGMLGYANLAMKFSGGVIVKEDSGPPAEEKISFGASRHYFKLGAKLGWRVDFGKPGGFIFEPCFGYYGGIGLGDTLGKKLSNNIEGDIDLTNIDPLFKILEGIFIGGPRLSLAFGWRF